MVEHLAEMIIPEDDTPGAKEAGVAEFIDFMLANRVPVSSSRDVRSAEDAIEAGNETQNRIPEAEATRNLTLLTNALVRCVVIDKNGMAKGIAYVDRATRKEVEVYAKVVVLAASCVETAHIMLNSKSRHWPTGIANSSGQLGRNLCDHLYGSPGYGFLPRLLGQPATPDNIADSTVAWMPCWQNLKNPREQKFVRGYSVYIGGGCGEFPGYYGQIEGFGAGFKRDIKRYYPTSIGALIQAPTLPSPTNYVDVDPEKKDIFGIPQLRFHFQRGQNELLMWEHSKQVMMDLFKAMGGEMGVPTARLTVREPACTKQGCAALAEIRRRRLRTSGRKLTTFRISTSVTQAFSRTVLTKPPPCPSSPLPCAPVTTCWTISKKTFTSAHEKHEQFWQHKWLEAHRSRRTPNGKRKGTRAIGFLATRLRVKEVSLS
jgi:hypothetical protein